MLFEYRATPEEVVHLNTGKREKGWRIQYRRPGVRRWTRFLLCQETFPIAEDAELMLLLHEAHLRPDASSQELRDA